MRAVSRCSWGGNFNSFFPYSELQRSGYSEKTRYKTKLAVSLKRCLSMCCLPKVVDIDRTFKNQKSKQNNKIIQKHKNRTTRKDSWSLVLRFSQMNLPLPLKSCRRSVNLSWSKFQYSKIMPTF